MGEYNAFVQETCVSKFLHLPAFRRSGGYAPLRLQIFPKKASEAQPDW